MSQNKAVSLSKVIAVIISFFFIPLSLGAQTDCGSHEIYQEMMKNDPVFRMNQELSKKNDSSTRSQFQGIVTIPVVFHVV